MEREGDQLSKRRRRKHLNTNMCTLFQLNLEIKTPERATAVLSSLKPKRCRQKSTTFIKPNRCRHRHPLRCPLGTPVQYSGNDDATDRLVKRISTLTALAMSVVLQWIPFEYNVRGSKYSQCLAGEGKSKRQHQRYKDLTT